MTNKTDDDVIVNTTCFAEHKKLCITCTKSSCKYWIDSDENYNCTIIASDKGEMTLQKIGDIFDITRMRVCQIEKSILEKLLTKSFNKDDYV